MKPRTKHQLLSLPLIAVLMIVLSDCGGGPPRGRGARSGGGSELTAAAKITQELLTANVHLVY